MQRATPDPGPHSTAIGPSSGTSLNGNERSLADRLLNHFVRPRQYRLRNDEAEVLGSFQVDYQIELRRLLDGQVAGLGALENLST